MSLHVDIRGGDRSDFILKFRSHSILTWSREVGSVVSLWEGVIFLFCFISFYFKFGDLYLRKILSTLTLSKSHLSMQYQRKLMFPNFVIIVNVFFFYCLQ